jgi:hypothetical protein
VRPRREIASRACMQRGRLLAAEHSSEALPALIPSQFRQSLPAARVVTHKTEASVRVSPQSAGMEHLDAAISPSHPNPRTSTSPRTQPSCAVSHPADTRHTALGGAMVPTILSEISDKFITLSYRATPAPSAAHSSFVTYLMRSSELHGPWLAKLAEATIQVC